LETTVKTHFSFNGELSHGIVTQAGCGVDKTRPDLSRLGRHEENHPAYGDNG
jgi:hypothetical protein